MRSSLVLGVIWLAIANIVVGFNPIVEIQEPLTLLTFIVCICLAALSSSSYINPVSLMCIATGVFLLGRFIVSYVFGYNDYADADWFIYGAIEEDALARVLGATALFFCGIVLGAGQVSTFNVEHDPSMGRFSLLIFLLLIPFCIYRIHTNLSFFDSADYLALFLDGGPGGFSYALGGWSIICIFAFLASKPRFMHASFAFGLGVVLCLMEALKGSRGIALGQIIAISWLFLTTQNLIFSIWKAIPFGLVLVFIAEYMGRVRVGVGTVIPEMEPSKVVGTVLDFVFGQGTSLLFVAATAENLSLFSIGDAVRSTFALFIDGSKKLFGLLPDGQSADFAMTTSNLSHRVAYMINPDMYLSGMGMGGSAVAESMLYSEVFGSLIAGLFIGLVLYLLCKHASGSSSNLFVLASTLPFILLVPRETQLYFVIPLLKSIFFIFVMKVVMRRYEQHHA